MSTETLKDAYTGFFKGSEMVGSYKTLRPTYPKELAKRIVSYVKDKPGVVKLAVDVGCGSGQSTHILSDYVDQVLGVDLSEDQIKYANNSTPPSNVNFKVGSCGDIPVETGSVDLITVGTAIHWFNLDDFYKEVDRVLRPGGCLAIYTYYNTKVEHPDAAKTKAINDLIAQFEEKVMNGNRREGHWADILCGENTLVNLKLPYETRARDTSQAIKSQRSVASMISLIMTYSECKEYMRKNPGSKVSIELQNGIMSILDSGMDADNTPIICILPLYLSLARKPE